MQATAGRKGDMVMEVRSSRLVLAVAMSVVVLVGGCGNEDLMEAPADSGAVTSAPAMTQVLDTTGGKRISIALRSGQLRETTAPETSVDWDLSLKGYALQTNSGPSGPGKGGAYGPITAQSFDQITSAAVVPHPSAWRADRIASPFDGWYLYNKCPEGMHTLASRHHVYGVEVGGKRYKLQILSYYGLVMGAPQSGRFTLRYAEVSTEPGGLPARLEDLDASAKAVYIDLASGAAVALSEAEAKTSMAWDVGFRKSEMFVNGGLAGPKGCAAWISTPPGWTATPTSAG
jgi:hypothetical protein